MLLIFEPGTTVLLLGVRVCHDSLATTTAFLKLTYEDPTVLPNFCSLALHVSTFKLARIRFLEVCKVVNTVAFEDAVDEGTLILAAISPLVATTAILLAVNEVTLVP